MNQLVTEAKRGNSQAFEALITPYEEMVWRVCWQLLRNREDAEDAAQVTMLKAWQKIASYREDAAFSSWIYRIAVNVCQDHLRQRGKHPVASLDYISDKDIGKSISAEAHAMQDAALEAVLQGLDHLPAEMRTALVLSCMEGKSYEEIAVWMGSSTGTVKSRISRAREKLRGFLQERGIFQREEDENE